MQVLSDTINELSDLKKKSPEFEKYTFKKFMAYAKDDFEGLNELCEEDGLPTDMSEDWAKGF